MSKWKDLFKPVEEAPQEKVIRPGVCITCGQASFELAIVKHHLLRKCKTCNEVIDTENMKVIRKGNINVNHN